MPSPPIFADETLAFLFLAPPDASAPRRTCPPPPATSPDQWQRATSASPPPAATLGVPRVHAPVPTSPPPARVRRGPSEALPARFGRRASRGCPRYSTRLLPPAPPSAALLLPSAIRLHRATLAQP
nr:classical arabinogalactan protein 9-like [Aegilops tauschii subsp. strangulata]